MKIKKIEIKNFRGINGNGVSLDLSEKLNVFVGVNGAGKTTILDAVATSLSWLVNRIQRENVSGRPIPESSIKIGSSYSSIDITAIENNRNYKWKIAKTARGNPSNEKSELTELSELALHFQDIYRNEAKLPVVAYYPINRVVENISPKISGKESLNILDVYENALGGKTNYQSFFEWFRLQDDIVNEKAQSRSKWMIQNKNWIRSEIKKLLSLVDNFENKDDYENAIINRIKADLENKMFIDEPENLLHTVNDLLHIPITLNAEFSYLNVFPDIPYLLTTNFFFNGFPLRAIKRIVNDILQRQRHGNADAGQRNILINIPFLWETLLFSTLICLWSISDEGKKEIEKLFAEFYPLNKNYSNVAKEVNSFVDSIDKIVKNDTNGKNSTTPTESRTLTNVTYAVENFAPGYSNLRVERASGPQMLVDKDGETMSLEQLSDGEKNLIALVGDIARRLSMANSDSRNPLKGNGIILIDEVDLHLHPSWQRLMVPKLTELFPNCQFFITTHSPQVISHVHPESIFLLKNIHNVFSYSKAIESYGKNTDRILEDLLGVDARPKEEKDMLHHLFKLIQDDNLEQAKAEVEKLSKLIGNDPEIVKAEVLIKRKEIIGK